MHDPFGTLSFHPLTREDLPRLFGWMRRPHVADWWDSPVRLADVEKDYSPSIDGAHSMKAYIAHLDREPIGFIQTYVVTDCGDGWWESEDDPGARGIDQFLADPSRLNQGLGSAMIRRFTALLFDDPAVTKIQADPSPANHRAIRGYVKAGFVSAGEVITPDGIALLMRRAR